MYGTTHSIRLAAAAYAQKKARNGGQVCGLASTCPMPAAIGPSPGWTPMAAGTPGGRSRTTSRQMAASAIVARPMTQNAPRQPTAATRAASGYVATSEPSTPTVAVMADIVPKCEAGNHVAATL